MSLNTISLNVLKLAKVSALIAVATGVTVVVNPAQSQAAPASAPASLWDYAIAGSGNGTGGAVYDYKGIAIKESGNDVFVALNTNMKLGAQAANTYNGELITYGDLFLNFTGQNFKQASDAGKLMAVHFATVGSQSGVSQVGLYNNVTAKNVTLQNYGWNNTTQWSNAVGGNNSYGDLTATDSYFAGQQSGTGTILNEIKTGKKVGDIMMLDAQQLAGLGLNFGAERGAKGEKADGSVTLGFKFAKTADFKAGNFIANLFAECGNDGLAIKSSFAKGRVPEPATLAGMAVVGGLGLLRRKRRQG
jgi:hypothetical protein